MEEIFDHFGAKHGGRRSIAGIAQHSIPISIIKEIPFKIFPSPSIFQRNPFKNFFHFIFFTGKSLYIFSKKLLLRIFFKNSLQEGDFENSLKFLQLVPNLTPIRKLFCTFSPQCCYYSRPPL